MVAHIYNFLIWEAKGEGYCEFQEGLKKGGGDIKYSDCILDISCLVFGTSVMVNMSVYQTSF